MRTDRGKLAFLAGLALVIGCRVAALLDAPPNKVIDVTPARVVDSAVAGSGAARAAALVLSTARGGTPPPLTAHRPANAPRLPIAPRTTTPDTPPMPLD